MHGQDCRNPRKHYNKALFEPVMIEDRDAMDLTDSAALEAYRAGDRDALEALIRKYQRPLFGYVRNMTGRQEQAEEVFQEVWLRLIRNPTAFRGGNFMGWLVRVAHNLVIDEVRRRKPDRSLDEARPDDERPMVDRLVDPGPGPSQKAEAGDMGRQIAAAAQTLPPEQREVFLMRAESGMSFKEIASVQGVSINTALARMQYALAKLRPLLDDEYRRLVPADGIVEVPHEM